MRKLWLFNPARRKYSKGERSDGGCYFCEPEKQNQFHIKSYEYWYLIANKYPFIDYALLVIPHRHVEFLDEIGVKEWAELRKVFKQVLGAWRNYYLEGRERSEDEKFLDKGKPSWNVMTQRFSVEHFELDEEALIYINNGEHSGRTVPHLHFNVVPRFYIRRTGMEIMGHFQKVKVTPEETQELFKKLLGER